MSDPSLNLTFTKLAIRVAEYLGHAYYGANGDEAAQIPSDPHDLDVVTRLVNDGYARALNSNPNGWRVLTVPFKITLAPQTEVTITGTTTGTVTVAGIAGTFANDYFNGWEVSLVDASTEIEYPLVVVDYTGATGVFTFAALSVPTALISGDTLLYAGPLHSRRSAPRRRSPRHALGHDQHQR